jgi:hypothetical protein
VFRPTTFDFPLANCALGSHIVSEEDYLGCVGMMTELVRNEVNFLWMNGTIYISSEDAHRWHMRGNGI